MSTARVEEIGTINVPKILEVSVVDGKWTITKEFIDGTTLEQMMEQNPDKVPEYIEQMVDIHMNIMAQKCPLLNRLKEKMTRQIESNKELNPINRYDLLTRLDAMPKHTKLCHGDFEPSNVIMSGGKAYIIDWVHATQGNASADVARTYLLLCQKNKEWADMYLDKFCEKSETDKRYVQAWLPIVAAAQLTKKRPEEKELLMKWIDVVDYM